MKSALQADLAEWVSVLRFNWKTCVTLFGCRAAYFRVLFSPLALVFSIGAVSLFMCHFHGALPVPPILER